MVFHSRATLEVAFLASSIFSLVTVEYEIMQSRRQDCKAVFISSIKEDGDPLFTGDYIEYTN
ncbi:hypothetical protein VspSTUT16_35960 [Vibrio sp. STUT-A16]|nr:hypothetical protein VspSTUT16_35960 [Vibrio sp. STUT-A16]